MADRKISMTPPLSALASDAEAAGIGFTALLTADIHRARVLARRAWREVSLDDETRAAASHIAAGMEQADILAGIDDIPSAQRIAAEMHDAGYANEARRWMAAEPTPLAIWGLLMATRGA